MKEWILSVVGVIALGVLVDILLPSGKMAKYVRGAFSLLVVLVISSILPIIANADFQIDFDSSDFFAVESEKSAKLYTYLEQKAKSELEWCNCECDVQVECDNTVVKSVRVIVYASEMSADNIVAVVTKTLGVNKNLVRVIYLKEREGIYG